MMLRFIILFVVSFLSVQHLRAQGDSDFLDLEFEFGLGYAQATDKNLFNDIQGIDPGGAISVDFEFRYHFDYNWSAGVHVIIIADALSNFDQDLVLGYQTENSLAMTNVNLGINGKYTHDLGRWQPFGMAGIGAVLGSLTLPEYELPVNEFTGVALDLGLGLGYMATNELMISSKIMSTYGFAWWKIDPSYESINREFNPGYWALTVGINYFFQAY